MTIEGIVVKVTPENADENSPYGIALKRHYNRSAIRYYRGRMHAIVFGVDPISEQPEQEIAALERLIANHLKELERLEQLSD